MSTTLPRHSSSVLRAIATSSRAASPSTLRTFSSSSPSTSHVGSLPIPCPPSVTFSLQAPLLATNLKASSLHVSGPKGQLAVPIASFVRMDPAPTATPAPSSELRHLRIAVEDPTIKHQRAVWGLTRSLLANAVVGVSSGYTLALRLVGVGYRASVEDVPPPATSISSTPAAAPTSSLVSQRLNLKLGYAHPVLVNLPPDVRAETPSTTTIVLSGIDKQRLGEVAARIRSWRVPEPYNGKGIFVGDEVVRRKEVKKK